MKRRLALGALVALPVTALVLGLRARGRAVETADTHGWVSTLEASVHNVQRRIDSWRSYHVRETAIVAALVADDAPSDATGNRLERARHRLGAQDLWVIDSAGGVLEHAGRSPAPPVAGSSGVRLARVGGGVLTVTTVPVDSGTGRVLVRMGPIEPGLRRILPFPFREYHSSHPVTVFRSGDEIVAVRTLQREPGGRDTVEVEVVSFARAPLIWRAALAGRDTSGVWREAGEPELLAAIAAAPDGSFGVISALERHEAHTAMRRRLRTERIAASVLFAALATIVVMLVLAARTARRRRVAEAESRELETRLARAELEALRVQLQPHFLFNTLNTVVGLVDTEPAEARAVVERLSALLRVAIRATADTEVELAAELEVLAHYVAIQETRFRGRLTVDVRAEPGSERALVPSLILQPLVENAIRHGTAPRASPGRVEVIATVAEGRLTLEVRDDGVGIAPAYREGIGLSNTRARLESLFGDDHRFTIEPRPEGGTVARLEIPLRMSTLRREVAA